MNRLRPFRYWLPELMNRAHLPDWIMYQARRNEVAAVIRRARRDGIALRRDCHVFKRAPKRKMRRL